MPAAAAAAAAAAVEPAVSGHLLRSAQQMVGHQADATTGGAAPCAGGGALAQLERAQAAGPLPLCSMRDAAALRRGNKGQSRSGRLLIARAPISAADPEALLPDAA